MADIVFKACCGVKHPIAELHDGVAEIRCPVCGRSACFRVSPAGPGKVYALPEDAAAAAEKWNEGVVTDG